MLHLMAVLALAGTCRAATPRIEFQAFRLPNGMQVVLAPDRSVPVTALAVIWEVGGRHERPGRSGFAHLFEHLMFEGSRNVPEGGFDRILESHGADNNASTHKDFTFYYEEMPSNVLPVALWLEADRISALSITTAALANQIAIVKEEKRLRIDNEPYGPALNDEIPARAFANWQNAHSTMGSFKDLESASMKDVQGFFDAHYAPKNGILALAGDFDPAEAKALVEKYFAWIPNRSAPTPVDAAEPSSTTFKSLTLKDAHANLPALALAWRSMPPRRSPDFYALTVLGHVLLQGKGSRLYRTMVKDRQVAVSIEGGLGFPESDFAEFKAPALFGLFAVRKSSATAEQLRDLIEGGIQEVARAGVGPAELERVKTKFKSNWLRGRQTALGRAQALLVSALLDKDPGAANGELERFLAVTAEDLKGAAGKYFGRERLVAIDVQPAGGMP